MDEWIYDLEYGLNWARFYKYFERYQNSVDFNFLIRNILDKKREERIRNNSLMSSFNAVHDW